MTKRAHGIGLLSGGLDSALVAKVVHDASADVTCLHFVTGSCVTAHRSRVGRRDRAFANPALQVGARNDIRVELVDISGDNLAIVLAPRYGYGAHMTPCVDGRVFMLRRAKAYMESVEADLADRGNSSRLRDLVRNHRARDITMDDVHLLGVGRHFRLSPRVKVIVGRDETESRYLDACWHDGGSRTLSVVPATDAWLAEVRV